MVEMEREVVAWDLEVEVVGGEVAVVVWAEAVGEVEAGVEVEVGNPEVGVEVEAGDLVVEAGVEA